jgi:hypothetical protein
VHPGEGTWERWKMNGPSRGLKAYLEIYDDVIGWWYNFGLRVILRISAPRQMSGV